MTTASAGSGLQISFTYQQDPSTLPSGFVAALNYAAQQIENIVTSPVTVDISVFYGNISSGDLGSSEAPLQEFGYSEVQNALAKVDPGAAASLPATGPSANGNIWISNFEAAALGLTDPIYTAGTIGVIGFSSSVNFAYDPNDRAVPGAYDFIGVAEHEITEVMGRGDYFGNLGISNQGNVYSLLDMFHYTAPGTHTYTGTQANYFSLDGGNTQGLGFNTASGGDLGDWALSGDSFSAFNGSDQQLVLSQTDITELNALGYQIASSTNGVTPSGTNSFAIQSGAAVGLGSVAITDQASTINSASVTIADSHGNPVTGDELFVNGIQNGAAGSGVTASWNASTSTLTLSGAASLQTYDTLLSDVTYQDTGTDTSTGSHPGRTVTWTVNDGTQNLTGTSGIAIDRAPVETPVAASASLAAGASVSAASLFNAATDADSDAIQFYIVGDSNTSVGQWYLNGQPVSGEVTASALSQLSYQAVSAGTDNASLQASDGHTLSSAQGDSVAITVTASGGGSGETLTANDTPGQQLTGTPYNDTFYAGHSSVVMTGEGGADHFIFQYEPWSAGSITDFTPGTDVLDLSALLKSAGYTGSNPVTDGLLAFQSDGQGDTQVFFHDPANAWPTLVTTLDGVAPSQITPADYGYGSSSGGGGATISVISTFSGNPEPNGTLLVDAGGNLIGTTQSGGANNDGAIFEVANTGSGYASAPTILASFDGSDGQLPLAGLIADAAGNLYGTTDFGGASGDGAIFELAKTANGYATTPTVLASFDGTGGVGPGNQLVMDAAGDLFGITERGPSNAMVFELAKTASGYASAPTMLAAYDAPGSSSPLVIDANGDLFGVALSKSGPSTGSVFEIAHTASGYATMTTLATLGAADGTPSGALVADSAGDLFGLTDGGGANNSGEIFEIAMTTNGYASSPTVLASFPSENNHAGALLIDGAGDLFAQTLPTGGATGGELFELAKTASGYASTLTAVTSLDGGGASPMSGLVADSAGHLFGTASGNAPMQNSEPNSTVWEITGSGFVPTSSGSGTTGETLTADDSAGQHLTGTPNDDTFFAGHSSVIMTGNGGADTFVFQFEPWNAGSITDFTPNNDKLDVSALLHDIGYTGSDPVADGVVTFQSDGSGDTQVLFHDPANSWPTLLTTLDNVAPTGLTTANTLGTAGSSSGGGGGTGGGTTGETLTANDTAGQQLTGTPNNDIFYAGHNSVVMTGNGGADQFIFQYQPWNAGSITDFNTAADVLNLKGIFASIGYTGSDPVADGHLVFQSDGSGDTQVIVNPQGPGTQIPITVTTLDHVDPSMIHSSDYIFA